MDCRLTLITPVTSFSVNDMKSFFSMLKKQTNQNFECIIVFNGENSTINKALSLLKTCNAPDNVVTIRDDSNTYIGGARNRGINYAKGDYISFVDFDDVLNETFVETTYKIIESGVDAIVYNYSIISVQADGTSSTKHRSITKRGNIISGKEASELCIKKKINKPCWNKVIKKEILENPFFLYCNGEDYCMPLILKKCSRVYLSDFESYFYFLSSTSSSQKSDYENCFYSLILSAIVLNTFGLSFIEPIMGLSKEDFYKSKIVFKVLNIKSEFKAVDVFYKHHKECVTGKLRFKSLLLFLLSKTTLGSKFAIKLKREKISIERINKFLDLYLDEAVLSLQKFSHDCVFKSTM